MTAPPRFQPSSATLTEIARELRDEYPAVDVTTVVFSADFSGVGCCVIPQDRILAIISDLERHAARSAILDACCDRIDCLSRGEAMKAEPQPDWNYTSQPGKLGGPSTKD